MGAINRTPALPFLRVHHGSTIKVLPDDPTLQSAIGAQIVKPLIPRHIPASFQPLPPGAPKTSNGPPLNNEEPDNLRKGAGMSPHLAVRPSRNDNKAGQ